MYGAEPMRGRAARREVATMTFSSKGSTVLALVAIALLAAYIVACRASFSPDGKKILFMHARGADTERGVAVFDIQTGETRAIPVDPEAYAPGNLITGRWSAD